MGGYPIIVLFIDYSKDFQFTASLYCPTGFREESSTLLAGATQFLTRCINAISAQAARRDLHNLSPLSRLSSLKSKLEGLGDVLLLYLR
jgi:hypothetical protein